MKDTIDDIKLVQQVINERFFGGHQLAKMYYMETDDLINSGVIGLIKARHHFDDKKGTQFGTYAYSMIYGEIRRLFRDNRTNVHFSRTVKELAYKVRHLQNPTPKQLMDETGTDWPKAIEVIHLISYKSLSIEKRIGRLEGKPITLADMLPAEHNVEQYVLRKIELEEKLSLLSEQYRLVTQLSLDGLKQKQIAQIVHISQSRVSAILKKAIAIIHNEYLVG